MRNCKYVLTGGQGRQGQEGELGGLGVTMGLTTSNRPIIGSLFDHHVDLVCVQAGCCQEEDFNPFNLK